jgi:hypothetical protein
VVLWDSLKGYDTIQAAYDNIADSTEKTIRIKAGEPMAQDLFFDRDIPVRLEGGYDDTFENVTSFSTVAGKMIISYGKVTISNLKIGQAY